MHWQKVESLRQKATSIRIACIDFDLTFKLDLKDTLQDNFELKNNLTDNFELKDNLTDKIRSTSLLRNGTRRLGMHDLVGHDELNADSDSQFAARFLFYSGEVERHWRGRDGGWTGIMANTWLILILVVSTKLPRPS